MGKEPEKFLRDKLKDSREEDLKTPAGRLLRELSQQQTNIADIAFHMKCVIQHLQQLETKLDHVIYL